MEFKLHAPFQATGDQPEAIAALVRGVELGLDEQVLLGVTGSGKTFTMASVIEKVQRPTLVLAHNKTLAAQLCAEFKEFFPENAVEYFVSYYDYYQPEAYIPHTDTYIAKDASTNEEIDRLRLSATCALLERRDVIVVSSVSCIYGLGEPDDFAKLMISLRPGQTMERDELLRRLVEDRYERNDVAFERNTLPRARRRGGHLPRLLARPRGARGVLRRRDRRHPRVPARDRRGDEDPAAHGDLSRVALCDDEGQDGARHRGDRARAGGAGEVLHRQRTGWWRRSASTSGRSTTLR